MAWPRSAKPPSFAAGVRFSMALAKSMSGLLNRIRAKPKRDPDAKRVLANFWITSLKRWAAAAKSPWLYAFCPAVSTCSAC